MKKFLKALLTVYAGFVLTDIAILILVSGYMYMHGSTITFDRLPELFSLVFLARPYDSFPEILGISLVVSKFLLKDPK